MKFKSTVLSALLLVSAAPVTNAHHGWGNQYDTTKEMELTGVVKSVQWTNPHVTFKLEVDSGKPTAKLWTIESNSVGNLSRMEITKDVVPVGANVKVSGFGPGPGANFGLFMNHLLFLDGPKKNKEVVFLRGAAPRWSDDTIGSDDGLHGKIVENDINKRPKDIFSVWTVVYNDNNSHGLHTIPAPGAAPAAAAPPPPPAAMAAGAPAGGGMAAAPAADGKIIVCSPKSLTQIMGTPYPVQVIDQVAKSKKIIFKAEENDSVREINITGGAHKVPAGLAPSLMGYSTGVLDPSKKKLTVTTSNVQGSPDTVYTETFAISDDPKVTAEYRNRLNYTIKSSTSATTQGRFWQYQPGASVMPYGCENAK